jgi:hypothetical protein
MNQGQYSGEIKMKNILKKIGKGAAGLSLIFSMSVAPLLASSHAEAPLIAMDRYADNTDVYAFRSTEPGRSGFVTIIANFIPFQDPSGGPHFYRFDDTVLYEIKIDNTGDGLEDISYQFQFATQTVNPNTVLGQNAVNQDGIISSLDRSRLQSPSKLIGYARRSHVGSSRQSDGCRTSNAARTTSDRV